MSEQKVFVGSGSEKTTQYGKMLKLSFSKKDIETLNANLSEKGWVNVVVKEKKEKVEGKPSHYLEIDNWKPTPQGATSSSQAKVEEDSNNLPF